MNKKIIVSFEVIKNDNVYSLHLPIGAPFSEIFEAYADILKVISSEAYPNKEIPEKE